ncbi:MAG: SIMPL domain-containing protein [Halanaerobium sp.]|nr:SIMPL domain-containing protein [Halanaerobium sp.]
MKINNKAVLIIGIALIISSVILGGFFYQTNKPQKTISVVGIASRNFTSDTVKWRLTLEERVGPDSLEEGYGQIQAQADRLFSELAARQIADIQVNRKPIVVMEQYDFINSNGREERVFTGYQLQQSLILISNEVDKIEELVYNPVNLVEKGITLRYTELQYYSSRIDELKKEIIGEATVNARERAMKMLEDTDITLGKVLSINSGVFQITEPYSTMVSSGGIYDTSTRDKQIRVTVHARFELN